MWIEFKRICAVNAPIGLVADANVDWSHFMHLHRKSHVEFRLIFKEGRREVFLYKARLIYPLPFYTTFIAFREYLPEQRGYHQFYLNVRTGRVHHLNSSTVQEGEQSATVGVFRFEASRLWKWFPWLFKWLFRYRMRKVNLEDVGWIDGRIEAGGFNNPACAPTVPERFNLIDEFVQRGHPRPDMVLGDRVQDRL